MAGIKNQKLKNQIKMQGVVCLITRLISPPRLLPAILSKIISNIQISYSDMTVPLVNRGTLGSGQIGSVNYSAVNRGKKSKTSNPLGERIIRQYGRKGVELGSITYAKESTHFS